MSESEMQELRLWSESHLKVGNRQARLTLELIEAYAALMKSATEVCHWSGWARDAANHPGIPKAIFALKKAIEEMTGKQICEYN